MKSRAEKAVAEKKAKTRKQIGVGVAFLVVILAVAATVALQVLLESDGETLEDMEAAQCFNGVPPDDLEIVECNEPHHGELAVVLPPPDEFGDEYPGDPELQEVIEPECRSAVEDYTGAGSDTLDADGWAVVAYRPNEPMWQDGNRDTYCVLARGEGEEHSIPASGLGDADDGNGDEAEDEE